MRCKLKFLGAQENVTGSKYLLTVDDKNILIDCGLFQGLKELRLLNWTPLPINPKEIDAVILTHAHIDHSGYLPLLVKNGFRGPVYVTPATADICDILLPDSGFLQEEAAMRANRYKYSKHDPALPLYTRADAERCSQYLRPTNFHEDLVLFNKIKVRFMIAGHILGAASLLITVGNTKLFFSGDLGRFNDPIMVNPEDFQGADYLILESTYGDRLHPPIDPEDALKNIIDKTTARGGTVLIPAFAVGRSQSVIYYLYELKRKQLIPDLKIFLDSPMAKDVTVLYLKYHQLHRLSQQQCIDIFKSVHYVNTVADSKAVDGYREPRIIISASGMLTGGRVLHHLRLFAPDKRNTILFTGYQAPGTRGRTMLEGGEAIKIFGEMVPVHADIEEISSMSAHADYGEILLWLKNYVSPPKKVFITHGEKSAALALQKRIREKFSWDAAVPKYLDEFEIDFGIKS